MAHQHRRTVTMSWDGLEGSNSEEEEEEEEDEFFESSNRISTMGPPVYSSGSSEDEDYDDSRMSFASTVSSAPFPFPSPSASSFSSSSSSSSSPFPFPLQQRQHSSSPECHHDPDINTTNNTAGGTMVDNYDIWMAAPGSIKERRRRLLQGMGLGSRRDFSRLTTLRAISKKFEEARRNKHTTSDDNHQQPPLPMNDEDNLSPPPPPQCTDHHTTNPPLTPSTPGIGTLYRSRSDGDIIESHSLDTKRRQEELIGPGVSKQRLTRTSSALVPIARVCHHINHPNSQTDRDRDVRNSETRPRRTGGSSSTQFFLIKNLDTGKDFVVKECDENGTWNRLSDMQTGKQLTMEEFEKTVGHSPVVKELMRRQNAKSSGLDRKMSVNALVSRSFRFSKRRGKSFLRNIKSKANSMSASASDSSSKDKDKDNQETKDKEDHKHKKGKEGKEEPGSGSQPPSSEWVKVKQQGKPYKELTALRLCQEITAHQGSIWTLKFNVDGRYLASAGEDKVIHVWEVQECEIATVIPPPQQEEAGSAAGSATSTPPLCPSPSSRHNGVLDKSSSSSSSTSGVLLPPLEKKKKGKSSSKKGGGDMIPDYVQLPETVFALSEKPVCSFTGHLDDVLDLSWSPTKLLLLSSSMDKTVRLWDMESKTCLRMFAHNDYVTCIQFNPVTDDYFISGSLDAKLRIWSVPGRRVVDWADLHEMVTAACYSPDGQTAAVGSHKGSCRTYSINDGKLNQISNFEIPMKKKKTSKITGFEFTPHSPSELLVTSADSRIRIHNGSEVVNKFKGFRNTSSQIAASYSTSGHHVICPSEDSHVYIWRREDSNSSSNNSSNSGSSHGNIAKSVKGTVKVRSYEQFHCKDVSVAIPWPGSVKFDPPIIPIPTKKNARRPNSMSSLPVSLTNSPTKSDGSSIGKRLLLPPLPRKNTHKADNKDDPERNQNQNHDDNNNNSFKPPTSPESVADAATEPSTSSSLTGETLTANNNASIRRGDSHSVPSYAHSSSPSWSGRWSLFDGSSGGSGGDSMRATAWGLVIVTAGLGGEIRAYQNFGLPVRVARQGVLFS